MKADWTAQICPSCGTRLRTCCDSAIGDSHMTACYKLGPFPEAFSRKAPRSFLEACRANSQRSFPFTRFIHIGTP